VTRAGRTVTMYVHVADDGRQLLVDDQLAVAALALPAVAALRIALIYIRQGRHKDSERTVSPEVQESWTCWTDKSSRRCLGPDTRRRSPRCWIRSKV
jgi:hypothetical protein